ncbi:MAG TPA: Ku protein [Minicystis sp.]|nr:Ku protein [Minicystis sp.]
MRRPIWTGAISFGLVNVPVKLFTAVTPKAVRFHMLHDKDGGRIHEKRVCSVDGEEVPYEHVVKGYEIAKGEYVETTADELAKLHPEDTRRIDIEEFVELDEIDPIYFASTYYLAPDRGAQKAYLLLHEAMQQTGRVALGRVVLRTKQYLAAIRPMQGHVLALSTMQYEDEIVSVRELEGLPSKEQRPAARELHMAGQLVESLAARFDPGKYHDTYREKVLAMLEKKAAGEEIVAPKEAAEKRAPVDLMKALKASLAKAGKGGAAAPPKKKARPRAHPHKRAA